ncbi:E3 ubiquitin/ISG15 ligase TRIM25-like [Hyperolius riggenbachi]|uniref:E3 ubiquitin/ISG15 ligase TRIM25-like n=1 Tax=Hyperolius riggenbachi TaxID=752182 RepID=UPI0035A37CD8
MASAALREELECAICLSVYTDPVMLRCGHNFCRGCINRALDTQDGSRYYSCPECRKRFKVRPALHRNIKLRNIVENFLSAQPDEEEDSGIFCTYCVDFPVPAVKSCLHCEVSLCDKHLRAHKKSPEHVLCDPTTSLEDRKCSVHNRILEYYCTEDSACVCVSCRLDGDHWGHQVETLDEASEKKKRALRDVLQKLMTQKDETEKRVRSVQVHRQKSRDKAKYSTEKVVALFRVLRKRLEDLEKKVLSDINKQAMEISSKYNEVIRQLEIKKDDLTKKVHRIEELCNMTDPLTVLQESDTGDTGDTEDRHDSKDGGERERHDNQLHDGGDLDVASISHTLHTGLSDIIPGVNVHFYMQDAEDIILDINTAANDLHLSDDEKTASWSDKNQSRPETPERFQCSQVLSSQSFSSGRHYWEVDVRKSHGWIVGVGYPSIDRRGDQSLIGGNDKSWGLVRDDNQYSVVHDCTVIGLPDNISSAKIRIYLDYEAGQISFYDICAPIRHLHTFTATFTEPLHAVLGVGGGCVKICSGN